jgi:signal transduction histidine kinase
MFDRQRELLKAQQARVDTVEELDRISYSMVHEMRAPLRAMNGFAEFVQADEDGSLTDDQRGYLQRIQAAARRMDHLVRDILRYSSMLREDLPLSAINVSELLHDLIEKDARLALHKADIDIAPEIPIVSGHADALCECFYALIDNAFKYCRTDVRAKVRIWAEDVPGYVRIFVEDNGTGMSKDLQEKVFGIFQRGAHSRESTGISLAIVRVTIHRLGGRVGVVAEEGKGSRFWIDLRHVR